MRKVIFISWCILLAGSCFASGLDWEDISSGNMDFKTVAIHPLDFRIIYAAAKNALFRSTDAGHTYRRILSIQGGNAGISFLLFDPRDQDCLYAATDNGLFRSLSAGEGWRRIFQGKNYLENECITLAVLPYGIYLGTKGGLFTSKDKGRSWSKETGKLGNTEILAIAYNLKEPDYIYIASADGVFRRGDTGKSWERIFVSFVTENNSEIEERDEDIDEEIKTSNIRYISIGPNNANYLYLATSRGVYRSQDKGQNWESLSSFGLLNRDVRFLLTSSESLLYALTKSGVFEYMDNRWQELSLGLVVDDIRFLALDNQNNLYAACDKGLFKANLKYVQSIQRTDMISLYSKGEPNINEVQQAAIKYAEVEPGKIMRWRKQAKMKAVLPKLTVGLDNSQTTNYEIYTSATTRYVYEGPYDRSWGWDVRLSWDLGDLIWNSDQTSIDLRSRLMVQLRPLNVPIWSL